MSLVTQSQRTNHQSPIGLNIINFQLGILYPIGYFLLLVLYYNKFNWIQMKSFEINSCPRFLFFRICHGLSGLGWYWWRRGMDLLKYLICNDILWDIIIHFSLACRIGKYNTTHKKTIFHFLVIWDPRNFKENPGSDLKAWKIQTNKKSEKDKYMNFNKKKATIFFASF